MKPMALCLAVLLALPATVKAQVSAVPNSMNFQGRLATPSGNPVPDGIYSVRFSLHDALTAGTEKYSKTITNVTVRNGTFAITLDAFPVGTFNGNLWLEVKIGTDAALAPRTLLVSVPYAIKSNLALTVPDGSLTMNKFASGVLNANAWLLGGNSGTNAATQFLGTTDNQPLTLKVNNLRALQISVVNGGIYRGISVLGGHWSNSISNGIAGATVFGGITLDGTNQPNRVTGDGGTVSGGMDNLAGDETSMGVSFTTVGGGRSNTASFYDATVAGGAGNTASNYSSFVGGGAVNTASGFRSTVAGGDNNTASGTDSTVAGGYSNLVNGAYATVPGGFDNTAAGAGSFAAGNRARANHNGAWVWADYTNADFASTATNQFLIRAGGGVGINTTNPGDYDLYVAGPTRTAALNVFGPLYVSGTLHVTDVPFGDYRNLQINGGTGQLYYDNSSRKHKRNITPLIDDFDKLLQAVPMTYTRPNAPGRWEIGFIAEEFDDLGLKRLVDYSDKGEVEGINYEKICLYLTAIAKKQNDRLTTQEKQNAALKAENADMRAELELIKAAVRELQNDRK